MATKGRRIIAGMAGAQAAAGDLLRARAGAVEEHHAEVDEQLVAAASGMFGAFEAFYKARRMYQDGHPALDRFFVQLEAKLATTLGSLGELSVALTPVGLSYEGETVFAADRPEHNMWFPLYRDGIRELTLSDGLDRDQIGRFCGALTQLAAIKRDADEDDGEDDAVTLLWDLALDDIGYVAIDSFADDSAATEDARARVERIREIVTISMMKELVVAPADPRAGGALERAHRLKTVALSSADLKVFERDNLMALDELPARIREANGNLFVLPAEDRGALARGLDSDPAADEKLLEAIVLALLDEDGAEHADALFTRVERAFTAIVLDGRFDRAVAARRRVIAARSAAPNTPQWAGLDTAMSSPAAIAAIVDALATRDDDHVEDVMALVEVLPPASATTLIVSLGKIEQRRRRRRACDVIATWGAAAVEGTVAALDGSTEELALDLLYLLRGVASPAASVALERATHHPAPSVRATSLRLYAEVAPAAEAAPRLRTALRDSDVLVRAAALEVVLARRPAGCERWVEDAIRADAASELDLGERKRLFCAHAVLGGERAATDLLARLEQRNLLQRQAIDDDRVAAASALGQVRHGPARAALERLAHSKLVRASVRTACVEALAELDRPAAPAPAPPIAPVISLPEPVAEVTTDPPVAVTFKPASPPQQPAPPPAPPRQPTPAPAPAPAPPAQPAHAAGTGAIPRTPPPAHATGTAPLHKTRPATRATAPGIMASPRDATTRPDSRSASGRRPMDDGVVVRPRSGTLQAGQPVKPVTVTPPAGSPARTTSPTRAGWRAPVTFEDERGVPRAKKKPDDDPGSGR